MRPNIATIDNGMSSKEKFSKMLVNGFGFSNGWAELALYGPPPFVPSSLIASCEANGPPGMCCSVTSFVESIVVAIRSPLRLWIAPWEMRTTVNTSASGSRMRTTVLVMSTQKLPIVRDRVLVMPRMRPTTIAMPAAADTKFCTVKPIIWLRWLIATSPENHCQLVFVTKLIAALNAPIGVKLVRSVGLKNKLPCRRSSAYRKSTDMMLNARSESA